MAMFSDILTKYHKRSGLSKSEIAGKVGISLPYFIGLCSGKERAPTMDRVKQIADALYLNKEDTDALLTSAAEERTPQQEREIIKASNKREEFLEKNCEWAVINKIIECPHCKKAFELEVNKQGSVDIFALERKPTK